MYVRHENTINSKRPRIRNPREKLNVLMHSIRVNLEYKEPLIYGKTVGASGSLYPGFNCIRSFYVFHGLTKNDYNLLYFVHLNIFLLTL